MSEPLPKAVKMLTKSGELLITREYPVTVPNSGSTDAGVTE